MLQIITDAYMWRENVWSVLHMPAEWDSRLQVLILTSLLSNPPTSEKNLTLKLNQPTVLVLKKLYGASRSPDSCKTVSSSENFRGIVAYISCSSFFSSPCAAIGYWEWSEAMINFSSPHADAHRATVAQCDTDYYFLTIQHWKVLHTISRLTFRPVRSLFRPVGQEFSVGQLIGLLANRSG